jgi:hypothetical protein
VEHALSKKMQLQVPKINNIFENILKNAYPNTIKTLQSLDKKKFRQKYNLFLVEGNKIIRELPNSAFKIQKFIL